MKRILVIGVIVLISISAIKNYRGHRRAPRHDQEHRWSWPNESLSPRPAKEAAEGAKFHFASAHGNVHITTDEKSGLTIQVDDPSRSEAAESAAEFGPETEAIAPPAEIQVVSSDLKYTEDRAFNDLKSKIRSKVSEWLASADVSSDWQPPQSLIDASLAQPPRVSVEERDYGTMYVASAPVDFSRGQKARFITEYHRHLAGQRLGILGGGLAFVLACLGIGVGYVRTDEATKGYYTNRLRLVAAAGVGAVGVLLYQWITRV